MSCSMLSQRSYLAEMEEEDGSFFEPRSDFPIMSGDSGKVDRSFSDIKRRTPASVFEMRKEKEAQSMKQSLSARESKLSEQERIQYDQYKTQLGGDSEKLYFLDIPTKKFK